MNIRDRIVGLRRIPARELRPNPANWRTHPQSQQDALRGILAEVGYVDALLAVERDGGYMLLDGHLRAETTPDAEVPVLVVDLSDEEAAKVLATFDPLSAMAEADGAKLDALLREVETGSAELQQMLADIADKAGLYQASDKPQGDGKPMRLPSVFEVSIECRDEAEQKKLYERMKKEGRKCRVVTV